MSTLHVRQIATFLRERFEADLWRSNLQEANNLSRLLARHSIDMAFGMQVADTPVVVEVVDGGGDRGIDAIGVDPTTNLVVLVQAKWRNDGSGSVDLAGVLKFLSGIRSLLDIDSSGMPECSPVTKAAIQAAMQTPGARVKLVIATTASHPLSDDVERPIIDLMNVLNDVGDDNKIADYVVFTQSTIYNALSARPRESIDLDLTLLNWGKQSEPVTAFYGRASASVISSWFVDNGDSLFAENIRVVLPRSEINEGIQRTVLEDPERFWYYNNGITILATRIERAPAGSSGTEAAFLKLHGASVVNGAQTVSTLGELRRNGHHDQLEKAFVNVRCIEVVDGEEDLGRRITRYANTQNVVSAQDFLFLDVDQHRLASELRLLGYDYILRSGEKSLLKDPTKILDVRRVAVALACTTSMQNVVQAKREVSRLFDRESGVYKELFNPSVNGVLVQRAVSVVDQVDNILDEGASGYEGVKAGVAVHGRRVIAHIVMRRIAVTHLSDPDFDFGNAMTELDDEVAGLLDAISGAFPEGAYPGNVFKNKARCDELVAAIAG